MLSRRKGVLVHNGVTLLFTPKKECQLKESPSGLSNEMYFSNERIFPIQLSRENYQKSYTAMIPSTEAEFPSSHLSTISCWKGRRRIKHHHGNATSLNCCTFYNSYLRQV